jgi:hypothetical protein
VSPEKTASVRGRPTTRAGIPRSEDHASLFVGPTTTAVEIPVRMAGEGRAGAGIITVDVAGLVRSELRVGRDWGTMLVPLPGAETLMPRQRINLTVRVPPGAAPNGEPPRMDIGQIRLIATK